MPKAKSPKGRPGVVRKKTFNGKVYRSERSRLHSKRRANELADFVRKRGWSARVVEEQPGKFRLYRRFDKK